MQNRGLNDDDIDRRGYRSLPIGGRAELAQQVVDFLGSELCSHVPGWYIKDGSWGLAGAAGTLIPVRDLKNRIIALKVRADDGDGPKYSSISSYNHGGAGAGAHIHVPLFDGDCSTVRVTEGELKADVATSLSGILTLGLPGVTNYRQVIPILKDLGASTVLLAIDADAREKKPVARAMAGLAKDLSEAD